MAAPIRVLVADDSDFFRKNLCKLLLDEESEVSICGEARDYAELLEKLDKTKPNVVLMDIRMPHSDGLNAETIKTQLTDSCLIAMSFANDPETAELAKRFGAFSLLDKVNLTDTLLPTIHECLRSKHKSAAG